MFESLKLSIETERWAILRGKTIICTLYNEGIWDEFHILFICKNADVSVLRSPHYYEARTIFQGDALLMIEDSLFPQYSLASLLSAAFRCASNGSESFPWHVH